MDVEFTKEDEAFRQEVRRFIAENYPKHLADTQRPDLSKEDFLAWHKVLYKKGWVAPSWPEEYGGTGWSVTQKYIWNEENAAFGTIPPLPFGVQMLGPVLYTFGTQEQKDKLLDNILSGETWWCQGYSEPGAGSDLAALKTKAVLDGDDYIVNGHKMWTTLAQHADWIFCLVRTAKFEKRQQGISFLLIDMQSPGITVRPIITIDGSHEVNEVFFEDVRVPKENLVGEQDKGWTIAKFLLGNERSGIAGVSRSKKAIDRLREIARAELEDGAPLLDKADFSRKIAELEVDLTALEYTELRTLASESKGQGPGPESSILKIKGTEIQQRITELTVEAVGNYAAPWVPQMNRGDNYLAIGPEGSHGAAQSYFNTRKTSIYGGSNEIQRNIIAKMILGL